MPRVNRSLLTPRWVLLHLGFVAAFATTLWLGWWQWERAHEAGGSFQNLGYALQWPVFGAFTLFFWYQVVRMRPQPSGEAAEAEAPAEADTRTDARGNRKRNPVPPPAPPVDADEDPELAAYNAYLADLNRADERH